MTSLADAALLARQSLESGPDAEGLVLWHSPMIWTSDIERSPCWWPAQELLEVIVPGRRIYYRRDELKEVRWL